MVEKKSGKDIKLVTIPDFHLVGSDGKQYGPGLFRDKHNLVLVFVQVIQCASCYELLLSLKRSYEDISALNAEILFIVSGDEQSVKDLQHLWMLPFPLLADPDDRVAQQYLGVNTQYRPALFIADRFGALWKHYILGIDNRDNSIMDILEWLKFIEIQCPECDIMDQPSGDETLDRLPFVKL